ncbi:hypothetical protein [Nigerium massiliense]|uniref:hypothetical protein n=1 Tax=Nigerium massiliense TaxID=1522317 RepID=UPI00058DDA3E|nr:hypothetical protein [Nigerium massiliense]
MGDHDVTLASAIAVEARKAASLPLMWGWTLTEVVVATLVARALASSPIAAGSPGVLTQVPAYVMVVTIVGAVWLVVSEYTTRQVSRSLISVPSRARLLAAKAVVVTGWAVGTGWIALGLAWAASNASRGADVPPAILLGGVYLALMGLIAAALSVVLRGMIVSLTTALLLLVVAPPLVDALTTYGPWLPTIAGQRLLDSVVPSAAQQPAALTLAIWVIATSIGAATRFMRSDA